MHQSFNMFLTCFVKHGWSFFSPKKCSKLEMKASDYLNSMENSVFQFTVSDFCVVEPSLINDV